MGGHLGTRAEALLGQPWEGAWAGCPFLRVPHMGSRLPVCPCAPLGVWRWAFDGLTAPAMGLGVAGTGYYMVPQSAIACMLLVYVLMNFFKIM